MRNTIWLGSGTDVLSFKNLEDDYDNDRPTIFYEKERFFLGNMEVELEDYQISRLTDLLVEYLKAKIRFQTRDRRDLERNLKKLTKARDEVKAMIVKDMESDVKIQGTGSEDFSIFEEEERLK